MSVGKITEVTNIDPIITDIEQLKVKSRDTTSKEVEDLNLIVRLRKANKTAWTEGCGLSAIQIGVPLRFAWYTFNGKEGTLLNPVITKRWGADTKAEGCLSIPHRHVEVERAWTIEYITNGKKKKANGILARLIQHEIDHMDGILTIDKRKDS